ncbi:MAG: hypothetical protein Q9227_003920 [Pyrenula ochraceoflavens]
MEPLISLSGGKRKHHEAFALTTNGDSEPARESSKLNLFGQLIPVSENNDKSPLANVTANEAKKVEDSMTSSSENAEDFSAEECQKLLKEAKAKIMDLSSLRGIKSVSDAANDRQKSTKSKSSKSEILPVSRNKQKQKQKQASRVYPQPLTAFSRLRKHWKNTPHWLLANLAKEGFATPTEVQIASVPLLLRDNDGLDLPNTHLLTVAPTGSGKTLAFLISLTQDVLRATGSSAEGPHGLVLAPTKELAHQIVEEGQRLWAGTPYQVSLPHSEMHRSLPSIIVATPQSLLNVLAKLPTTENFLHSIQHLVLDEADVLLDPLFREQTFALWDVCSHPFLRVSFWGATVGSNIESLVLEKIDTRCKLLSLPKVQSLIRVVIGQKDSALPTVSHKLIYTGSETGKLLGIRQLLRPSSTTTDTPGPEFRLPCLVFTQTIQRATALHSELQYDIPVVAGGSARIAVLHSDLTDQQRSDVMTGVRTGRIWILITTDLLSRGVDFRGVNGVVNYDIPTTSAAYVHRAGRTNRAGREGGVCITYWTNEDKPYLRIITNAITASAKAGKIPDEDGTGGVQKWLLDTLPDPSKKSKKELRWHGIKERRKITDGDSKADARAKRSSRISTESGYQTRVNNNRKGAILANKQRKQRDGFSDNSGDDYFEGFDD